MLSLSLSLSLCGFCLTNTSSSTPSAETLLCCSLRNICDRGEKAAEDGARKRLLSTNRFARHVRGFRRVAVCGLCVRNGVELGESQSRFLLPDTDLRNVGDSATVRGGRPPSPTPPPTPSAFGVHPFTPLCLDSGYHQSRSVTINGLNLYCCVLC